MPNHVVNLLKINGTPDQVQAVRDTIRGTWEDDPTGPRPIDFNKLVPMPPSLNVTSGSDASIASWEMRNVYKPRFGGFEPTPAMRANSDKALVETCKENIRVHGFPTWYEWSVARWGTKWNAYDQEDRAADLIKFETAWSTPEPIFAALAARFPDVEFVIEYADEDIGSNQGTLVYRNGCLAERREIQGDYNNPERRHFAYRLHGYSDEDIAERENERENG